MDLISIVIPAKDEVENIAATLTSIRAEFDKNNIPFEIIVVNDGSRDRTEKVVKDFGKEDSRIQVIHNTHRNGFGNAIKRGLEEFKGDAVIIVMADASDDPKDMIKYVKSFRRGSDCCFGTRWTKKAQVKGYPKHKLVLNRLVNWWISIIFGLNYYDVTNAFKCYSRETIQGIQPILSRHFNITVELPLKAIIRGYSYTIVPTNWYGRKKGLAKLKLQEMGSRYLFIVIYVFLERLLCGEDYKKGERKLFQRPLKK